MSKTSVFGLYFFVVISFVMILLMFLGSDVFRNLNRFIAESWTGGPLAIETLAQKEAEWKKGYANPSGIDGEIDPKRAKKMEALYRDLASHDVSEFFKKDVPFDEAHMTTPYILTWVALSVADTMTFSFNDIEARLSKSSRYFTDKGWAEFSKALEKSRILEKVRANLQTDSAAPHSAPKLLSEGVVAGRYQWVVQLPLNLAYQAGARRYDQGLLVTVVVVRSDDPKHPYGIGIEHWVVASP